MGKGELHNLTHCTHKIENIPPCYQCQHNLYYYPPNSITIKQFQAQDHIFNTAETTLPSAYQIHQTYKHDHTPGTNHIKRTRHTISLSI